MNEKGQVKEEIKKHLRDYAEETGRPTGKTLFNCFLNDHDDTNASMQFKGNYYKCYGCGKTLDIFSLYALDNNLDEQRDFATIKQALATKYNIPLNYTPRKEEPKATKSNTKKETKIKFTSY